MPNKFMTKYLAAQLACNLVHKDGRIEGDNEEACQYAKKLAKFLTTNKITPRSVLDVGCRTGYALETFLEYLPTSRIVGVDIIPGFVGEAKKRAEAYVADMHELPFKDKEFDWVFCIGSIEHAYDAEKACRELFRVASEGVFISADCAPKAVFDTNPSHYSYRCGPSDWVKDMQQPGWQLISLIMPTSTFVDSMWVSPSLWRTIQEPLWRKTEETL
jgi:ubiquinone/menaquinone biosynthesis C-methylase UbiE